MTDRLCGWCKKVSLTGRADQSRRGLTDAQLLVLRRARRELGVALIDLATVPGWGKTVASLVVLKLIEHRGARVYATVLGHTAKLPPPARKR